MSRLLSRIRFPFSVPRQVIRHSSYLKPAPSPPRLPAAQQAEFERLQRAAAVSSAFQAAQAQAQSQSSPSSPSSTAAASSHSSGETIPASTQTQQPLSTSRHITTPSGSEASPGADPNAGVFRGAPPEFEGDVNPRTGEVGGPKNEPLRWGPGGDYSYNGRVTDF